MNLPSYKCHKIVQAFKIQKIVISFKCGEIHRALEPENPDYPPIEVSDNFIFRHQPLPGGYYVRYPDGYESFSPAAAFEEGYTLIDE